MRCASNSPNEGAPVSVTLVKPAGADTLFVEHAKDHLDQQPKLPQPVYAPNVVARAILHATVRPPTRSLCRRRIARHGIVRTLGAARLRCHIEQARREGATHRRATAGRRPLDRGGANLRKRSGRHGRVRERSFYTDAYTLAAGPRTALIGIAGSCWSRQRGATCAKPKGAAQRRLGAASGKPMRWRHGTKPVERRGGMS